MRHLVIGQRQKAPNFSAFHWSPHGCLITFGQHFVTTRVVHLPKRTETSLITESDQSGPNHQLLHLCTTHTAWSDSDQAVRAVHSCISWLLIAVIEEGKLRTYNTFKQIFKCEPYRNVVNFRDVRKSFTRFRVSAHDLAIERGRYENIKSENRICKNC